MLRDFLELLDTNDAVFLATIATIGLMMAMLYLYGLCTDRVCAEQKCSRCHSGNSYLTLGGICQECAQEEMRADERR